MPCGTECLAHCLSRLENATTPSSKNRHSARKGASLINGVDFGIWGFIDSPQAAHAIIIVLRFSTTLFNACQNGLLIRSTPTPFCRMVLRFLSAPFCCFKCN